MSIELTKQQNEKLHTTAQRDILSALKHRRAGNLRCTDGLEDPRTYECWPSYETIGKSIGKSKSSVKRYVAGLVEKGLITVEPTSVIMRNGLKKNGDLRYHIRPIREAVEWYTQQKLYLAEAAAERHRVQRRLAAQTGEPPCSPR